MVIDDRNSNSEKTSQPPKTRGIDPSTSFAAPTDRLGAFIIDACMVLGPAILLLVSPLRKRMTEYLILENESKFLVTTTLMVLLSLLVIWIYQTVMITRFGATLGKMFCNLRIVQAGSLRRPTVGQASVRSITWIIDTLFLFPHISMFSHKERRTFHDRLSDTTVISIKKPAAAPDFWEKSFAQGIYAALFAFFVLTSIGIFKGVVEDLGDQSKILSLLEENGDLCASVGAAAKTWPEEKVSYGAERLNVAMGMFAAGIISKSCLSQEAEHLSSQSKEEEPLLYLAQSFIQSEDADLSNEYLDRVCQLDDKSEACSMSKVISAWSDENWLEVDKIFSDLRGTTNLHMAVWAVRHLMKQRRFFEALTYIETISPQKTLAPFLNVQRVKAYWNLNRFAEARAIAAGSLDVVDLYDSVELSSWLCQAELEQSCSSSAGLSCRAFEKYMANGPDLVTDEDLAIARVQQVECGPKAKQELETLASELPQERVRDYVNGLLVHHRNNPKQARAAMASILKESNKDEVAFLAKRRLIDWADSKAAVEPFYKDWSKFEEQNDDWIKLGKSLFYKYYSLGNYARSLSIGKDLMNTPVASVDFYEAMVMSAYHSGKRKDAYGLLKIYRTLDTDAALSRLPAAEDEFQVISRVLDRENAKATNK